MELDIKAESRRFDRLDREMIKTLVEYGVNEEQLAVLKVMLGQRDECVIRIASYNATKATVEAFGHQISTFTAEIEDEEPH